MRNIRKSVFDRCRLRTESIWSVRCVNQMCAKSAGTKFRNSSVNEFYLHRNLHALFKKHGKSIKRQWSGMPHPALGIKHERNINLLVQYNTSKSQGDRNFLIKRFRAFIPNITVVLRLHTA